MCCALLIVFWTVTCVASFLRFMVLKYKPNQKQQSELLDVLALWVMTEPLLTLARRIMIWGTIVAVKCQACQYKAWAKLAWCGTPKKEPESVCITNTTSGVFEKDSECLQSILVLLSKCGWLLYLGYLHSHGLGYPCSNMRSVCLVHQILMARSCVLFPKIHGPKLCRWMEF